MSLVSCFLEKRHHKVAEGREFAPEQNAPTNHEEWQLIPEALSHLSLLLSQIHKRDAHLMHFLAKSPFSLQTPWQREPWIGPTAVLQGTGISLTIIKTKAPFITSRCPLGAARDKASVRLAEESKCISRNRGEMRRLCYRAQPTFSSFSSTCMSRSMISADCLPQDLVSRLKLLIFLAPSSVLFRKNLSG